MNLKIKEIVSHERPREKLLKYGVSSLSNIELLAILLRSGDKNNSAIALSAKILSRFKIGIEELKHIDIRELMKINGIGIAKAASIISAVELSNRLEKSIGIGIKINSPKVVYEFMKKRLEHLKKEKFIVLLLDTKNTVFLEETVSIGSLNSAIVHPREVFKTAIKTSASSIIAVHNHPSGDFTPSKEDIEITKKLKKSGEIIGIELLDHIIVASKGFYSFKENLVI